MHRSCGLFRVFITDRELINVSGQWLHRIVSTLATRSSSKQTETDAPQIAGPKDTTVPQAGLDTKARAGPLAQLIVKRIVQGADPNNFLLYNPLNWQFANNTPFPANFDWLANPVRTVINGRPDAFSQR